MELTNNEVTESGELTTTSVEKKTGDLGLVVGVVILVLAALATGFFLGTYKAARGGNLLPRRGIQIPTVPNNCAADLIECPNGGSVGRIGPNCEFAQCPEADVEPATESTLKVSESDNWPLYTSDVSMLSFRYPTNLAVKEADYATLIGRNITFTSSDVSSESCVGPCPMTDEKSLITVGELSWLKRIGYVGAIGG